jgi:hypothetical protein
MGLTYKLGDRELDVNKVDVSVSKVPARKSTALCVTVYPKDGGAVVDVLAYFRNQESADFFSEVLKVVLPHGD